MRSPPLRQADPDDAEPMVAPLSASALLEQARRFDEIARRMQPALLRYFRKRGLSATDAEDLTQNVLLRLLHKMRTSPETPTDGYVFTAASSVFIDHHRRRTARGGGGFDQEIDPETPASHIPADKILEDRQALRVIMTVIDQMKPKRRRAFELHRFEALSYAQIAARMGTSVSSVEKYVMAALTELREALGDHIDV